jgi:protein ImuB
LPTLGRWGIATLGALAALPAPELSARLGQPGVMLQRLARGLDLQPLVPMVEEARFEASFELEWPVEDLQPLSFVLARLLEPLGVALERADRGAAAIVTELTLVRPPATLVAGDGAPGDTRHVRRLELPVPVRDVRVLRTLVLLDLESHPPPSAIEGLTVRLEPTPGRIVQFSLLERAGPQPETVATLVARLSALMGETRVGSPALVDSHEPGAFELTRCQSEASGQRSDLQASTSDLQTLTSVLRRFRSPVPARVVVERGRPVRVTTDRPGIKGGLVEQCAGPWRSSGGWWTTEGRQPAAPAGAGPGGRWNRDEYDVALGDGGAYRIYRDRHEEGWFIEGMLD